MSSFVTIRRSQRFSPGRHAENDSWILDATARGLAELGWSWVGGLSEDEIEQGHELPHADLVLNMAQGAASAARLQAYQDEHGAHFVNAPAGVLGCHRVTAVARLQDAGAPWVPSFVVTAQSSSRAAREWLAKLGEPRAWIKRGDVHAMAPGDVERVELGELDQAVARMRARLDGPVIVQPHLTGPIVKFYGIGDGWLRWLWAEPLDGPPPDPDSFERPLHQAALAAASCLGLDVFGGDAALVGPGRPMLIDVNDWPSFAPFREEAALAIADHVHRRARGGPCAARREAGAAKLAARGGS